MEKILFIINPIAGGGKAKGTRPIIEGYMKNTDFDYSIKMTDKPKDGARLAKEGVESGYTTIVAVGGDGTVNEVAIGILESGKEITLGILPSGTGNDMSRTLDIPSNIENALVKMLERKRKRVDIGIVNNSVFLNIASIGFDAEVVKNTEKFKEKIRSGFAYIIGILDTLIRFKGQRILIEIDDHIMDKAISLVAVGNGRYYGGGLPILPMASVEDGYFHVIVVNKVSRLKLLLLLPTIFFGKHIKLKRYVEIFKAKKVKLITDKETYLNVDGEIYNINGETLFSINSGQLSIYC